MGNIFNNVTLWLGRTTKIQNYKLYMNASINISYIRLIMDEQHKTDENLFLQSCVLCHVLDRLRAMLDFCQNCLKLPYQNYSYRCITQSCVYRDQKQVYCTASDWCLQKLSWLQFGVNLLCTYNVLRILDYSECGDHIYIYGNYTWFNREFLDEWQKASRRMGISDAE
ncbi:Hypothetical_protein [Hexamita inflata]|uniref:Hypothetical_protein n=1 Tax=Hexamita inflata TaxID=28002 RepID=A0AA86R0Y5_9EUKA|nr:Hypothetical protein HINF_LOCUS57261 [Hexamita inflata]